MLTDDRVEDVGVEIQDDKARVTDPNTLITTDVFSAAKYTYHARPEEKFTIPNAWVLQFVNPKWSYNKDDWKTYKLNWKNIDTADTWREEVKKDLETDMAKWNDKIWLVNWLRTNELKGPEVVWFKYSNNTWHSKQPLRWADPKYGTPAPPQQQQTYIQHEVTGIDWWGIRDLNANLQSQIKALKEQPSEFMQQVKQFCDKGVNNDGKNLGDFVIKASHLSESQGVFVTMGGKLIKDIKTDIIQGIKFPALQSGKEYTNDPDEMEKEIQLASTYNFVPIFEKFPNVKRFMDKFTTGFQVCGDNERAAYVHLAMKFQEMIWVSWESSRSKIIPRGTLFEKLRKRNLEIKVTVGLGHAWGYYYNSIADSLERLTEEAKNQAYELAQDVAVKARVDLCRADIIVGEEGLIISELTLVPGLNWITKTPLDAHMPKLQAWHLYINAQANL